MKKKDPEPQFGALWFVDSFSGINASCRMAEQTGSRTNHGENALTSISSCNKYQTPSAIFAYLKIRVN